MLDFDFTFWNSGQPTTVVGLTKDAVTVKLVTA